jgi:hypothetical protein
MNDGREPIEWQVHLAVYTMSARPIHWRGHAYKYPAWKLPYGRQGTEDLHAINALAMLGRVVIEIANDVPRGLAPVYVGDRINDLL